LHPKSFEYLEHCRAMLGRFPLAVEFRNKTWFDGERRTNRTLAFERDNGLVKVWSMSRRAFRTPSRQCGR
jgi:uncharacterized protein YecE (DUF72 family)